MNFLGFDVRGRLVKPYKNVLSVLIFLAISFVGLSLAHAQTLPLCPGTGGGAIGDHDG